MSKEGGSAGTSERGGPPVDGENVRAEGGQSARFQVDAAGDIVAVSEGFLSLTGYDRATLLGRALSSILDTDDVTRYGVAVDRLRTQGDLASTDVALGVETDEEVIPCTMCLLALASDVEGLTSLATVTASGDGAVDSGGAETSGEAGSGPEDAATKRRLDDVVRAFVRTAIAADSRRTLETAVCRYLTNGSGYEFAWIGREHPTNGAVAVSAAASVGEASVADVAVATDDPPFGTALAERAVRTRETQVGTLDGGDSALDSTPTDGYDRGTVAAVPVVHDETCFGVLVVYAATDGGFDDSERAALSELARTVGYAISNQNAKRALLTERVTELEFDLRDDESFLVGLSAAEATSVTFEGTASRPDESLVVYATVRGMAPDRIREIAERYPRATHVRVVTEHDGACVIETQVDPAAIYRVIAACGGSVTAGRAREGVATLTVALPVDADTHEVLSSLRRRFDAVTLRSQRETERPVETRTQFRAALARKLTDRQLDALRSAYHAGYFEWPRESTGEDIAFSLGVSPPTFHKHLRLAERKVIRELLDGSEEPTAI